MPLIVPILDEVCIVIKIKAEWDQRIWCSSAYNGTPHEICYPVQPYWLDGLCALTLSHHLLGR